MSNLPTALDPLIHQPIRTRLLAFLAARGEATFSELKQELAVTDGNLDAHLKKLLAAGYLDKRKDDSGGRPQTLFALTAQGSKSFKIYLGMLERLIQTTQRNAQ